MRFFVGLHKPQHAAKVGDVCISVNVLRPRRSAFEAGDWIADSGAFTKLFRNGGYPEPVAAHAREIERWWGNGNMVAAVCEDYMCEPFILKSTGLSVLEHQQRTIARYAELRARLRVPVYVMPVIQGYEFGLQAERQA